MAEIQFADGMELIDPKPNTPSFILNKFYFNAKKFSEFLKANESEKGWVYVDMLVSKGGKVYFKLNSFKPKVEDTQLKEEGDSEEAF